CAGGQRALEKASAAEPGTTLRTRRDDHGRRDLHSWSTSNQSLRTKSPYLVPAIVPRQAKGEREPFQPVADDSGRLPGVNPTPIEGVSAMDLGLKGRVALVTGGSKGIGKAVARGLVEEGVRVAICARSKASLEEAARELAGAAGAEVFAVAGDLTRPDDVQRIVDATVGRFGRIDILVNNAGAAPGGEILDLTEEDWQKALQLKFMGYVRCIKAVLPARGGAGGGGIATAGGTAGAKPIGSELSPGGATAAHLAMTVARAEQYGRHNILVNAINPGPVATERWGQLIGGIARM